MNICYLCDKPAIKEYLIKYLGKNNNLTEYNVSSDKLGNADVVLIVEPLESIFEDKKKGVYISVFKVWKRFLKRKNSNIKLVVAGFEELEHSNYLQLLAIKKDDFVFSSFVQKAQSTLNQWEKEMKTSGLCVLEKLSVFFKGHHNQGIIDTISHLRGSLQTAEIHYYGSSELQHEKQSFKTIWTKILFPAREDMKLLFSRWYNYHFLFKFLPFQSTLEEKKIHEIIVSLNKLTSGKKDLTPRRLLKREEEFKATDSYSKIDTVIKVFNRINKRYINVEFAGRILIIDDDAAFYKQIVQGFPIYEIVNASTSKDALSLLSETKINLIFLDLNLETDHQDGFVLLKKIGETFPSIPVVMASTSNNISYIDKALEMGAKHYLLKTQYDIKEWDKVIAFVRSGKSFSKTDVLHQNQMTFEEKPTILVIDDEEKGYKNIQHLGKQYHYEWATSLLAAEDVLKERNYDLIVLDLIFEDENGTKKMQGLDFIATIKKIKPEIPIIVFTNDDNVKTSNEAIRLGADYFLRKDQYNALMWDRTVNLVLK